MKWFHRQEGFPQRISPPAEPSYKKKTKRKQRLASSKQLVYHDQCNAVAAPSASRAGTITGVFSKKLPASKVGLVFCQATSDHEDEKATATTTTYIDSIDAKIAKSTQLVPGLVVRRINGVPVKSAAHASTLVRTARERVLVETEGQLLETKRRDIGLDSDGLSLALKQRADGRVQIHLPSECFLNNNNKAGSPQQHQEEDEGQVLLAVNGTTPVDSVECAEKLLAAKRTLRLVLVPSSSSAGLRRSTDGYSTASVTSHSHTGLSAQSSVKSLDDSCSLKSSPSVDSLQALTIPEVSCPGEASAATEPAHKSSSSSPGPAVATAVSNDDGGETSSKALDPVRCFPSSLSPVASTPAALGSPSLHQQDASMRRMVVSLVKPSRLCNSGLSFTSRYQKGIVIRDVSDCGLFAETPLRAGDRLVSINQNKCVNDVLQVHKLLSECEGRVTLEVLQGAAETKSMEELMNTTPQRVFVLLQKDTTDAKIGLCMRKGMDGARYVHHNAGPSLLGSIGGDLLLPNGSKLERINGKLCPESRQELCNQLQTFPMLTLEVSTPPPLPAEPKPAEQQPDAATLYSKKSSKSWLPKIFKSKKKNSVKAKVVKPHPDSKVGLTLRPCETTGAILIAAISPSGLFANTDLRVGQKILTINKAKCPKSMNDVADLIRSTLKHLRIEAESVESESKKKISITAPTPTIASPRAIEKSFQAKNTRSSSPVKMLANKLFVSASTKKSAPVVSPRKLEREFEAAATAASLAPAPEKTAAPAAIAGFIDKNTKQRSRSTSPPMLAQTDDDSSYASSTASALSHEKEIAPSNAGSPIATKNEEGFEVLTTLTKSNIFPVHDPATSKAIEYAISKSKQHDDRDQLLIPKLQQTPTRVPSGKMSLCLSPLSSVSQRKTRIQRLPGSSTTRPRPLLPPKTVSVPNEIPLDLAESGTKKRGSHSATTTKTAMQRSFSNKRQYQEVDDALNFAKRISKKQQDYERDYEKEESELMAQMTVALNSLSFDGSDDGSCDASDQTDKTHNRTPKSSIMADEDKLTEDEIRTLDSTLKEFHDAYQHIMDFSSRSGSLTDEEDYCPAPVAPPLVASAPTGSAAAAHAAALSKPPPQKKHESDLDAYAELVGEFDDDLMAAYLELKKEEESTCREFDDSVRGGVEVTFEPGLGFSFRSQDSQVTFEPSTRPVNISPPREFQVHFDPAPGDESETLKVAGKSTEYSSLSTDLLIERAIQLAKAIAEDEETVEFNMSESERSTGAIGGSDSIVSFTPEPRSKSYVPRNLSNNMRGLPLR